MVLRIRGVAIPYADAALPSSSIQNCIIPGRGGAPALRLFQAEFLSCKSVARGGVCLHNSSRSHILHRTKKTDFGPPCRKYANLSKPLFQCVALDKNGAASACSPDVSIMESTIRCLKKAGIIACLRTTCFDGALMAAKEALEGGLTVVEVTMTTPSATKVIECLVRDFPLATIGAGTVLSMEDARMAKKAGAKFLTSPITEEQIVREHKDGPVLFIPGAMTPTEVVSAYNMGAKAVKLFPMPSIGEVDFVRALSKTLAHIPLIPSSGICLNTMNSYWSAGALAVVLSDAIFTEEDLRRKTYTHIRRLAKEAVDRRRLVSKENF